MPRFPGSGLARLWLAFSLALAAMGYVNLEPVREFANILTQAVAYSALVDQYIEVPQASVRYIKANPSVNDSLAQHFEAKVAEREAQRAPLLALHAALADYMAAIGTLLESATSHAKKAIKKVKTAKKATELSAAVLSLAAAIVSKDPKGVSGSLQTLVKLIREDSAAKETTAKKTARKKA